MAFKSLDELQWSDPAAAEEMQGIHSNSVLFYFMRSPYFDPTSNNNTVYTQALHNASMFPILQTRDRFEDFLKSMSGVEYIVHQAPVEMAPGTGTGVWVIRKQLRRKRSDGQPDDLTVYADYFVVGYNVYQAPTLADVLSARITSMAVALSKAYPAMDSMQMWSPARGHVYNMTESDEEEEEEEDSESEIEDTQGKPLAKMHDDDEEGDDDSNDDELNPRLAEESYAIHRIYGGEYMDEQPISGRPGEFHMAIPGSSANGSRGGRGTTAVGTLAAGTGDGKDAALGKAGKDAKDGSKSGGKDGKSGSPKTKAGTVPGKPKRRKSKGLAAA